ncbi:MAG: MotA/TolQ/ExbB proton channel family protein [Verrucomicrobia bacterium]|nr:MotA/TolQ/ExbB proton channel family protein [Verrucomicrobiota bacterium]
MLLTPLLATSGFSQVIEFIKEGGLPMMMIIACSFASVTLVILKGLQLRWRFLFPEPIEEEIRNIERYATKGDISPLQNILEADGSVAAQLGIIAISGKHETREENNEACETAARGIVHRLEAGVPLLEVIVTIAPLIGLLGTIMGLVVVFRGLGTGSGTEPDPGEIARGIAIALNTTIAGLLVAVPTVIAHGYFSRKLDAISVRMEIILRRAIHDFHRHFEVRRSPLDTLKR